MRRMMVAVIVGTLCVAGAAGGGATGAGGASTDGAGGDGIGVHVEHRGTDPVPVEACRERSSTSRGWWSATSRQQLSTPDRGAG